MNIACVTTLNEAATIGALVKQLAIMFDAVIVVDNASTDLTQEIALKNGAYVIGNNCAQGIGPALMQAWQASLELRADRIVQIDAGGSHSPIDAKMALIKLANCDMVIGERFNRGKYFGRRWRAYASRAVTSALNSKTGFVFSDWTSGLRAFRADLITTLIDKYYYANMHGWQIEVLYNAAMAGARIDETPIYYRAGRSSMSISAAREALEVYRRLQ